MTLREFQKRIADIYLSKDSARGPQGTFSWLVEEVGELSRAMRKGDPAELEEEFADVLAWLVSLANLLDVDIEAVSVAKYSSGCPKCHATPCACSE